MFSIMDGHDCAQLSRQQLLDYLLQGAKPRDRWQIGMELEKMGRAAEDGRPIPFGGEGPTVQKTLEFFLQHRGGDPVYEADNLIGVDAPWGAISLEPGGQVEWSSRPQSTLAGLKREMEGYLAALAEAGAQLGIDWLDVAVDPVHPVEAMPWMPKARYRIMRPFLGARGRLAHRMMTQSASIQCAFDFEGAEDWARKFKAAALMTPLAVALFANSSMIDGADSGHRSYREVIWRETDPARCGLPQIVFQPGFSLESWFEWVLSAPTIFRHRSRGKVPTGGVPFIDLLELTSCDAVTLEDWESHLSTIFTEVRTYRYIEVRSADLLPDGIALAVPVFWTGILYQEDALEGAMRLGEPLDDHTLWLEAMASATRLGVDGEAGGRPLREMAREALALSRRGLLSGAACAGDGTEFAAILDELASYRRLR